MSQSAGKEQSRIRIADHAKSRAYLAAAVAIAIVVFAGFARNYYLRAWLGTRAITPLAFVHGAAMSAWIALFIAQTLLAARRRFRLHRLLGVCGAVMTAAILVLGISTIAGAIARQDAHASVASFVELFVAFDGTALLLFAVLVASALVYRRRAAFHGRLMFTATLCLLPPALGRLIAYVTEVHVELIVLGSMYASVLTCILADAWRHRRLHPAFVIGGGALIASCQLAYFAQVHGP